MKVTVVIENKHDSGCSCEDCMCEEYGEQEIAVTCPVATHDGVMNHTNKQVAIHEHDYGPATDPNKRCGNCGYFNQTLNMLDCIEEGMEVNEILDKTKNPELGYCQLFHFICSAKNVCNSWMKGGPIVNMVEEDDEEEYVGRRFI
jgi:hypothetical protein